MGVVGQDTQKLTKEVQDMWKKIQEKIFNHPTIRRFDSGMLSVKELNELKAKVDQDVNECLTAWWKRKGKDEYDAIMKEALKRESKIVLDKSKKVLDKLLLKYKEAADTFDYEKIVS